MADIPRGTYANTVLLSLRAYPACLLFYSIGIGAVAGRKYKLLNHFCRNTTIVRDDKERPLYGVHPWFVLGSTDLARQLRGYEHNITPVSNRVRDVLREPLRDYLPSESAYDDTLDRFEYLVALIELDIEMGANTVIPEGSTLGGPPGRFAWRSREVRSVEERLLEEADKHGNAWAIVQDGVFSSLARFRGVEKAYRENILAPTRRNLY